MGARMKHCKPAMGTPPCPVTAVTVTTKLWPGERAVGEAEAERTNPVVLDGWGGSVAVGAGAGVAVDLGVAVRCDDTGGFDVPAATAVLKCRAKTPAANPLIEHATSTMAIKMALSGPFRCEARFTGDHPRVAVALHG